MPIEKVIKSLQEHRYHKLIVGAALKEFEAIEKFSYLFTHAKANMIDISAFPLSVISAKRGIKRALEEDPNLDEPMLMVSVNIGEDPHFRRIEVNNYKCTECMQCVPSCPSEAFLDLGEAQSTKNTIQSFFQVKGDFAYNKDLCFGCSNCLEYCNFDALSFASWSAFDFQSMEELIERGANAIEIHLNNDLHAFAKFYDSLPDFPEGFMQSFSIGSELMSQKDMEDAVSLIITKVQAKYGTDQAIVIQTDGIPMSGARDLGFIKDKDQVSISNAKIAKDFIDKNYAGDVKKNIFVQIAGGINSQSLSRAFASNVDIDGVALGSYARKELLNCLGNASLEEIGENKKITEILKDRAKLIIDESKSLAAVTNS